MVTAVTPVNKQMCKVFLEEDFAFVLYKSEAAHYHIEEGAELSRETYRWIEEELLLPRAKSKHQPVRFAGLPSYLCITETR